MAFMSEFAKVSWTNLHNERGRINPETIEFPKETLTEMYSSVINRLDKNRAIAEQMFYNAAQHNPYILEKIGAFSISSEEIELEVVQKVKKLVESQALQGLKEYVGFTTAVSEEIKKSEELSRHLEICKAVAEAEDSISEIQHALDTYPETREDLLRKFTQLIPSPQLLRITRVSTQYEMICHQLVNFCIVHSNEDDEFILNLFLSIPDCFSRLETTSQTSDNKLSCALLLLKALKRSPHGGNLDSFKSIAQQLRLINGIIYNIPYKTQQKDLANLISEWESSDTVCQSDAEFSIFSRLISVSPLEEKPSKNIQKILWRMLWKISGLTVDPKIHFNLKLKYTVDQMYGESWAKSAKRKGASLLQSILLGGQS